jgi:hypothetical protein
VRIQKKIMKFPSFQGIQDCNSKQNAGLEDAHEAEFLGLSGTCGPYPSCKGKVPGLVSVLVLVFVPVNCKTPCVSIKT